MEKERLKKFAFDEFKKQAPPEIAKDEKSLHEFILKDLDEPLLDKLLDEFCQKNPEEFAVLNTFSISDEKLKEITNNIAAAIADGMFEKIKYEQIINHAALEYQKDVMVKNIGDIEDEAIFERGLRD
jgi:hypothetical protein